MAEVKGGDRTSGFMGEVESTMSFLLAFFLLAVSPPVKYFVWECRVRVTANVSGAMMLKSQIHVVSYN